MQYSHFNVDNLKNTKATKIEASVLECLGYIKKNIIQKYL